MRSMKQATRDGSPVTVKQDKLLQFLYSTLPGRLLLKPLTAPALSKAAGWFLSTGVSRCFIGPFVRKHSIRLEDFLPVRYRSYNEFFSRQIRPELRPVDPDPRHLISPCDCKLTALPITPELRFTLKHTEYSIPSLLKDASLADRYAGGYALIFRLTVDDYHRYCYVADGTKGPNIKISGVLHTVNPIANDRVPIYKENSREYSLLQTEHFGQILMMEVGALLVGRIVNHHEKAQVTRGQEKGYFQFGGSTVVLLLEPGTAQIDADLLHNSPNHTETIVKYGEKIGCCL